MKRLLIFLFLLFCPLVYGQDKSITVEQNNIPSVKQDAETAPAIVPQEGVEVVHNETDAVGWIFDALNKYPEEDRQWIRFIYIPPWGDAEWIGVADFMMNAVCSHTPQLVKGDRWAGGWLLGYNFRLLVPHYEDRLKVLKVWDDLAINDYKFHFSQINLQEVVEVIEVDQKDKTGKTVKVQQQKTVKVSKNQILLSPHLREALARHVDDPEKSQRIDVLLTQMNNSAGTVYSLDFLLEQLLTSIRGKYPEFRLFDFQKKGNVTPLQALLAKRGIFFQTTQDHIGERGALLLISDVTGKSRIIFFAYGVASRQPAAITFDFLDKTIRPDVQFIRNLIEFEQLSNGSEAFLPMPNGLQEYVLADAQGNLLRVAPPDLVADHNKPPGYTHELELGMSCIICHSPQDHYLTVRNDMELLATADTDYLGDSLYYTNAAGEKVLLKKEEAVAIVSARYGERVEEPDGILGRARRDYIRVIERLTDYPVTADGDSCVQLLGKKLKEIYHGYRYRRIGAQQVCMELGVRVPQDKALVVLRQLVPHPGKGQPEDIVISLLRNGAQIKRDDMDAIYNEMANRSLKNRLLFRKPDEQPKAPVIIKKAA
jgi:hypothetical protein